MQFREPLTGRRGIDITGKVFGRLTVSAYAGIFEGSTWWHCECSCGVSKPVKATYLFTGHTSSCGCLQLERIANLNKSHGLSKAPEYRIWSGMISRCTNEKSDGFKYWGGRGIAVCDRWRDFANFMADMGPRPSRGHSLDRYPDQDGNYEPGNVRWATRKQQARNTSRNRMITRDGRTLSVPDWAEEVSIPYQTINQRLAAGWTIEDALAIPYGVHRKAYYRMLAISSVLTPLL
jgi:hypothetical protein